MKIATRLAKYLADGIDKTHEAGLPMDFSYEGLKPILRRFFKGSGIDQLRAKNKKLLDACRRGLKNMELWESLQECDCPPEGHICGIHKLRQDIEDVTQAIAEADKE